MDRRAFVGLMLIETMLAFANTFAGSFNIIYLYKELSMPLWSGALYLGIGFTIAIFVSLGMSWKPHLDPRNALLAALAFLMCEYATLIFVKDGYVLSLFAGASFGLFYPLFWTPFNILMAQMTDKKDRGVTYGAFFFVWPAVTFIGPFLGGLVIGYVNYQVLFALGISIVALTAGVIAAYRKYIPKDQEMRIRLEVIGRRNVLAVLGEGGFEGIFWVDVTIVAWVFSQNEVDLGALFSLFGLSAGLMAIILGKVSDKIQNRRLFVSISAIASIPCVALIFLANSFGDYAVANGLLEFSSFLFPVFIFAILTDKLEEKKNDSVIAREFLLDIGRASAIAVLIALLYFGFSPQECFLLATPFLALAALAHEYRSPKVSP